MRQGLLVSFSYHVERWLGSPGTLAHPSGPVRSTLSISTGTLIVSGKPPNLARVPHHRNPYLAAEAGLGGMGMGREGPAVTGNQYCNTEDGWVLSMG